MISLICLASKNRSIADIVSGTHLCYQEEYLEKRGINPNTNNDLNNNYNDSFNDNYNDLNNDYNENKDYKDTNIDADWHEVDSSEESNEADSDDKYKIF